MRGRMRMYVGLGGVSQRKNVAYTIETLSPQPPVLDPTRVTETYLEARDQKDIKNCKS